jgi:hypothetical protein
LLYLSGVRRPEMPLMARPGNGATPLPGQVWAADTGLFGSYGKHYTRAKYLEWLAKWPRDTCLFATAPDVVGDAVATLALSAPMFAPIRALGYRVAFVAQDGWEHIDVPWGDFDALFIGGTTAWKLGPVASQAAREARRLGKWVHMGRVNSLRRMQYAESIGCDSADGTVLKHDPNRPVQSWAKHVIANPSIWREQP